MDQTTENEPDNPRDSAIYINKALLVSCDAPSDEPDITKEKIVDTEGIVHKPSMKQYQPILQYVVNSIPVIIGAVVLCVMIVDQGTDIVLSNHICNAKCQCVWLRTMDMCTGPFINPEVKENNLCLEQFSSSQLMNEYCNIAKNKSDCNQVQSWTPRTHLHPIFCLSSIVAILVPSIINSTYILISLWSLYPSVLRYMGLSDASYFFRTFKLTLLVLYILQILPYTWLAVNFLIILKVWKIGAMKRLDEKETWDNITNRWKVIFSILEDTPLLMLHSMFLINSVMTQDNGALYEGINMLNIGGYLGVTSSAASIALTLTLFKGLSTHKSTFLQILTTFISTGTRAGVCACYGASVIMGFGGAIIWPLALPPASAIALFTIECIISLIYKFVLNLKQYQVVNNVSLLRKTAIIKHIKEYAQSILSLTYEANSVQCLITSFTYFAYAVALNTAWTSAPEAFQASYSMTKTTFVTLQYLAFASLLLNLLIVQWEGKHKGRCLAYSVIFLIFMSGMYTWVKNDYTYFERLFIPEIPTTDDHVDSNYFYSDYVDLQETIQISLSLLRFVIFIVGIIVSINIVILIVSLIRVHRLKKVFRAGHLWYLQNVPENNEQKL